MIWKNNKNFTIEQFVAAKNFQGIIESRNLDNSGVQYVIADPERPSDNTVVGLLTFYRRGDRIYEFNCSDSGGLSGDYQSDCDQIISTFKFIE
ncbi:hypothetical protein KKD19_01145 [Patescibacteria group bacterium]|nr:hypothetical protein [Patescibacteria group bacterium]MBU4511838.1 hypothetical protein [Patescibacteria group bacterium]MCG2693431.1 hypothetical protein [Candidatus Parcubacteria bacterium]